MTGWHHLAGARDGIFPGIYIAGLLRDDPDESGFPVKILCEGDILTNDDPIHLASRAAPPAGRWARTMMTR